MSWSAPAGEKRPLKIVTCELLLRSLNKLASQDNVDLSLEYIRSRVEHRTGPDFEGSLKPVLFDGASSDLNRASGSEILKRLNALALSFEKNSDMQFVALEFRGKDNIERAIKTALAAEPELSEKYRQAAAEVFRPKDRITSTAINAAASIGSLGQTLLLAGTLGAFVTEPSFYSAGAALVNAAVWLFPINVGQKALEHNIVRHDWLHHSLIQYLQQMIGELADDRILIMGSNMSLPLEYHRLLMNFAPTPEAIEGGRFAGVRSLGSGLTLKCLAGRSDSGVQERSAFLDHIVFFDGETMEPVWIAIYRAYCPRAGQVLADPEIESVPKVDWAPSIVPAGL